MDGSKLWSYFCHLWPKATKLRLIFRRLWAKVENSPNLVGKYGSDRSLQRCFQIDDILFQSGDIYNEVAKSHS